MIHTCGKEDGLELYQRMFEEWMMDTHNFGLPEIGCMDIGDKQMSNPILTIIIVLRYLYNQPYRNLHITPTNILIPITILLKTTIVALGHKVLLGAKMVKGLVVVVILVNR